MPQQRVLKEKIIGVKIMEFNKINFVAQQAATLNTQVKKEETKPEEKKEAEVRDNKPAEKQVSGDEVFAFMAAKTIDVKVAKKSEPKTVEDRIAGYMADFEAAYEEAASLGLSDEAIMAIFDKM